MQCVAVHALLTHTSRTPHARLACCRRVRAPRLLPVVCFVGAQLAEEDAFDSEKDAASVAYNAAVKGAAKVGGEGSRREPNRVAVSASIT